MQAKRLAANALSNAAVLFIATGIVTYGSSNPAMADNTIAASPNYMFKVPAAGTKLTFSDTLVDNLGNTISVTLIETITLVNPDGTFVTFEQNPDNKTIITGAVTYSYYPISSYVNSIGQPLSQVAFPPGASSYTCTFSPHAYGAPSPFAAGQTWNFSYTRTCGNASPITYTQAGTYLGTESVTVPAGTFLAYKFQSDITWTNSNGVETTQSITLWRNASGGNTRTLKQVVNYIYAGTAPPQGSIVSATRVLQSYQ